MALLYLTGFMWHDAAMARSATTHSMVTWPFFEAARKLGLPVESGHAFMAAQAAPEAAGRLAHDVANEMLKWGVELSGRPDLGLLAAGAVEPGHFDLVELASRSQATVEEGLATLASLLPLLHDGLQTRLTRGRTVSHLSLRLVEGHTLHPAGYDFIAGTLFIAGCRQTGRSTLPLISLQLPYSEPAERGYLEDFFQADLVFGSDALGADFATELLDVSLVRSDGAMGKMLEQAAKGLLPPRPEQAFVAQVQGIIRQGLADGASLATAARQLHLSERTLRRRLADAGLGFREVVDRVRHEAALAMLTDPGRSTDAIAEALGFTTTQAFHRAFRRWTGSTVQAHRARRGPR